MPNRGDIDRINEIVTAKAGTDLIDYVIDEDGSGVADVFEVPLQEIKPLTYEMITSDKKSNFWKAVRATLAGETTVGVIGRELKNVLKNIIPFGRPADAVLDQIGAQFQSKSNNMGKENLFTKIKRYIKQPSTQSTLALIVTILGSSWIGINIDADLLTQSLIGIVTGAAAIYTASVNIYQLFRDEDKPK